MDMMVDIIRLGRLPFLGAGFILYSIGALLAGIQTGNLPLAKFILGYAIVMPAHLSVSYSNDYFDFEADRPGFKTTYTGGSGVLQRHPELREFAKNFALILIVASMVIATIYALIFTSPVVLILAGIGNLIGWFYSAPPLQLSYRGLGELSTSLTGLLFPGMGYLIAAGKIDLPLLMFAVPLVMLQLVFIINVEIPDHEVDRKGGKRTFPVRKGINASFKAIFLAAVAATITFGLLGLSAAFNPEINFWVIALLSLIVTIPCLSGLLKKPDGRFEIIKRSELIMNSLIAFGVLQMLYLMLIS